MGSLWSQSAGTCDTREAISDQRGVSRRKAKARMEKGRGRAGEALRGIGDRRFTAGRGSGPRGLFGGNSGTIPSNRAVHRNESGLSSAVCVCADWSPESHGYSEIPAISGRSVGGSGPSKFPIPIGKVETDRAVEETPFAS